MKARVSNLHKIETEWLKFRDWIPEAGELIVYDPDDTYPYARLKVGDGVQTLAKLSFFIDEAILALMQNQHYSEILDAGPVKAYKK